MKKMLFSLILALCIYTTSKVEAINVDFTIPIKFTIPNKIAYAVPALFYTIALINAIKGVTTPKNSYFLEKDKNEHLKLTLNCICLGGITNLIVYKLLNK